MKTAIPRRITCVAVVACAAALGVCGPALAREVQVVPVDIVGEPLCSTEPVHVTGTGLVTYNETTDATGATHTTFSFRLVHTSAVNLVTGTTYRVIESDHQLINVSADGQWRVMSTTNALLIATDRSTSTMLHMQFMQLIDLEGNFTSPVDHSRVTCLG